AETTVWEWAWCGFTTGHVCRPRADATRWTTLSSRAFPPGARREATAHVDPPGRRPTRMGAAMRPPSTSRRTERRGRRRPRAWARLRTAHLGTPARARVATPSTA